VDEAKPFKQRSNIGSRVTREGHARFWERPEVKFLRATRRTLPLGFGPPNGWSRRISPVLARPGERHLTEPTPAVKPCRGNAFSSPETDLGYGSALGS